MVSVDLDRTFVNLVSTGELVSAYTGRGRSREFETEGSVQPFAGGRFRSIAMEGLAGRQVFMLRDVSEDDIETLKGWIGETVLVRDNRGRRMFGTYYKVGYNDRMEVDYHDVTIELYEVTYQEGA